MPRPSPFARGFRSLRREPSVLLAEIAWRWLVGGIATALLIWAGMVFLRAIEVSKANQFLLRTFNPQIIGYVLRDLLQHRWGLLARLGLIVSVSLSFVWILTATVARTATTRVLLERSAENYSEERETRPRIGTVATIHFVRVTLLWIGVAAYIVSALIAGRVNVNGDHPGAFVLLFLCMFLVAAAVLSFFNWILLLAPIFALRDGLLLSDAIIAAWQLTREHAGSLAALNLAHLALRLIWLVFMSGVGLVPFGLLHIFPKLVIALAVAATMLLYCAVADALFVARYAGYIEIAEQQLHPVPELPPQPQPLYPGHASDATSSSPDSNPTLEAANAPSAAGMPVDSPARAGAPDSSAGGVVERWEDASNESESPSGDGTPLV